MPFDQKLQRAPSQLLPATRGASFMHLAGALQLLRHGQTGLLFLFLSPSWLDCLHTSNLPYLDGLTKALWRPRSAAIRYHPSPAHGGL